MDEFEEHRPDGRGLVALHADREILGVANLGVGEALGRERVPQGLGGKAEHARQAGRRRRRCIA